MPPLVPTDLKGAGGAENEWGRRDEPLMAAVSSWLRHLGLAEKVNVRNDSFEPDLLDITFVLEEHKAPHDVTEVGFGLSQVLPVLAAGLTQPEHSVFIVDLPEAHLHPRPQSDLADFFCSLALSNRFSIVETHSEMFFHRLRLRAAMNNDLLDRIAVYFLDPPFDGLCSRPRPVGLSFHDELKWPPGFLQEAWETEAQIEAVRSSKATREA